MSEGVLILPDGSEVEVSPTDYAVNVDGLGTVTAHANKADSRLIMRFKLPVYRAIARAMGEEIQEAENMFWNVLLSRYIDHAEGVSLDYLGNRVGERRQSQNDPNYRVRIRARVLINKSRGLAEDILAVGRALGSTLKVENVGRATMRVDVIEGSDNPLIQAQLAGLLAETAAAGVGLHVSAPVAEDTFRFGNYLDELRRFSIITHNAANVNGTSPLLVPYSFTPYPGSRLFLQVASEGPTFQHAVYSKIATGTETGTTSVAVGGALPDPSPGDGWDAVSIHTNASGSGGRSIGRIYEVRAPALDILTLDESDGSGDSIFEPVIEDPPFWALAFLGYDSGGTWNAFSGGYSWTEASSEAVAGSAAAGIGISLNWIGRDVDPTTGAAEGGLSDTALWSMIAMKIGPRTLSNFGSRDGSTTDGSRLAHGRRV